MDLTIPNKDSQYSSVYQKFDMEIDSEFDVEEVKTGTDPLKLNGEILSKNEAMDKVIRKMIDDFAFVLNKDFCSLDEAEEYLEIIAKPNKSICAGLINDIQGWRCEDCFKNANTIYCHFCYIKSKGMHKNHKVLFLRTSSGMCDCGDEDAMYCFCPEHSGLLKTKTEIEQNIRDNFDDKVLSRLRKYFQGLFINLYNHLLYMEIPNDNRSSYDTSIFYSFDKLIEHFVFFIRKITSKNTAMLHLVSEFLVKNYSDSSSESSTTLTAHDCITIENDKITVHNFKGQKHMCKCPFLRLLLTSLRTNYDKENSWIIPFNNNYIFQSVLSVLFFFLFKKIFVTIDLNMISDIYYQFCRTIHLNLILEQTNFFEKFFEYYFFLIKHNLEVEGQIKFGRTNKVYDLCLGAKFIVNKTLNYEAIKTLQLSNVSKGLSAIFRLIDVGCLVQNKQKLTSVFPHPEFTNKNFDKIAFLIVESDTLDAFDLALKLYVNINNEEKYKAIFAYFKEKIIGKRHQILEKNEYSVQKLLYRLFGNFLNNFCIEIGLEKHIDLKESLDFVIRNYIGKDDFEVIADIIIEDYTRMFAFILGTSDYVGLFLYYEHSNDVYENYFQHSSYYNAFLYDASLMKYLILGKNSPLSLNKILRLGALEVSNSFFEVFVLQQFQKTKEIFHRSAVEFISNYFNLWTKVINCFILIVRDNVSIFKVYLESLGNFYNNRYKNDFINKLKKEPMYESIINVLREQVLNSNLFSKNLTEFQASKNTVVKGIINILNDEEFKAFFDEMTVEKVINNKTLYATKQEFVEKFDANTCYYNYAKELAQKYILDFQKEKMSVLNVYYMPYSSFERGFYYKVFELFFLSDENLDFMFGILSNLVIKGKEDINLSKVYEHDGKTFLVEIFNYFANLFELNLPGFKEFGEFIRRNKEKVIGIYKILVMIFKTEEAKNNGSLSDNSNNINIFPSSKNDNPFDIDEENQIKVSHKGGFYEEEMRKMAKFVAQKIYNLKKRGILPLEKGETLEAEEEFEVKKREKLEEKKRKLELKKKLKMGFKKKVNDFTSTFSADVKEYMAKDSGLEKEKKENDNEIMCFSCRNTIVLNSMEIPYGMLCNIYDTNIPYNSFKMNSIQELYSLAGSYNIPKEIITDYLNSSDRYDICSEKNMSTCGHFYHTNCFQNESINFEGEDYFNCKLCNRQQKYLIPALTNMLGTLKGVLVKESAVDVIEKIYKNEERKPLDKMEIDINLSYSASAFLSSFVDSNDTFIETFDSKDTKAFFNFTEDFSKAFKSLVNLYENIVDLKGSTFHKNHQIELIQDFILCFRYCCYYVSENCDEIICRRIVDKLKDLATFDFVLNSKSNNFTTFYTKLDSLKFGLIFSVLLITDSVNFNYFVPSILSALIPCIEILEFLKKALFKKEILGFVSEEKFNKNYEKAKENLRFSEQDFDFGEFSEFLKGGNAREVLVCLVDLLIVVKTMVKFGKKEEERYNELTLKEKLVELGLIEPPENYDENSFNYYEFLSIVNKALQNQENNCHLTALIQASSNIAALSETYKKILLHLKNNFLAEAPHSDLYKKVLFSNKKNLFTPFKLESKIFDLLEKFQTIPCCFCNNLNLIYMICLNCGKKFCNTTQCGMVKKHVNECGLRKNLIAYVYRFKIYLYHNYGNYKELSFLYTRDNGMGVEKNTVDNDFELNVENIRKGMLKLICDE